MNQQAFKRICKTIMIFAFFVGLLCISSAVPKPCNPSAYLKTENQSEASPQSYLNAMQMLTEENSDAASTAQTLFGVSIEDTLPDTFAQEVLGEEGFENIYTSDEIIGLIYAGSPEDAANYCTETLKENDWYQLEQNDELTSSFAKSKGTYHWLVLQFLSIEEKTVVIANAISSI